MPTTFDPTATAAPIGTFDLVDDGEVISETSYQEGEFKPIARGVRYQELHSLQDETSADALGDPDDANGGAYKLYGYIWLIDNGSDVGLIKVDANTSIDVEASGKVDVKSGGLIDVRSGGGVDLRSGAELDAKSGSIVTIDTALATMGAAAKITAADGAELAGVHTFPSTGKVRTKGRVIPRSARVPVPDSVGSKTLGVAAGTGVDYAGKRFVLATPTPTRTRILKSTDVVPEEGETIEVLYIDSAPGGATFFDLQREDATSICTFVGSSVTAQKIVLWAEFEFVSGVWRLGASSGCWYDGVADVGVLPGASA